MGDARKNRALSADAKVICFVCEVVEPLLTAHDHHRTPRAFGGTDNQENRVWLCAACHQRLHRVQEFLVQGHPARAYELAAALFAAKAKARGNLWMLACEAAEAEKETKEAFGLHRGTTKVTLDVDKADWSVIKAAAKDRKTSAKSYAEAILSREARR